MKKTTPCLYTVHGQHICCMLCSRINYCHRMFAITCIAIVHQFTQSLCKHIQEWKHIGVLNVDVLAVHRGELRLPKEYVVYPKLPTGATGHCLEEHVPWTQSCLICSAIKQSNSNCVPKLSGKPNQLCFYLVLQSTPVQFMNKGYRTLSSMVGPPTWQSACQSCSNQLTGMEYIITKLIDL